MDALGNYLIDATSLYSRVPETYPPSVPNSKIDSALLEKLKKFSYPFIAIAVVELGENSDCFEIVEGAEFISKTMNFVVEKKMEPLFLGKKMRGFDMYALDLSMLKKSQNKSFKPFLNEWIKHRFKTISDPGSKRDLIVLMNSINVRFPEEKLDKDQHLKCLKCLINKISTEEEKISNCFRLQLQAIPFWEISKK